MIRRFQSQQLNGRTQGKTARKRDSLKRFLRCEPLEDRRLLAGIFGYKFEDLNRNGMDDNEPRLPGVEIRVSYVDNNSNQVTRSTATGADGAYQFEDLPAATMTVTEVPPQGLEQTTANPAPFFLGATDNAVAIAGQSGSEMETVIPNLAFGNALALGSIYGYKFEDLNGNRVDDGEPRLADVEINLEYSAGNSGFMITTFTDAAGEYNFAGLPAKTMTITEVPPTGFLPTTAATTSFGLDVGENAVAIAGQSGMENETVIAELGFGNTVLGSIHGLKFEDINGNSIYEPNLGELPQAGVEFTLTGIDGRGQTIEDSMVTDSAGAFWFENLWPSVDGSPTDGPDATGYIVTEIVPNGFAATGSIIRTFDLLSRQELVWAAGEANIPTDDPRAEVLVGEALMFGNTVLGSIHGFKFEDVNGNGLYESGFGETGMPGVTFTLTGIDGSNRPVNRTTTTGIDGEFQFVGLQPSNSDGYLVSEVVPIGFVSTTPTSRTFNLSSRQEYVWQFGAADLGEGDPRVEVLATMDEASNLGEELIFGNVIPGSIHGFKFLDTDGDGIFDENEAGLADIPFQLTGVDGSGATIDTTVLSGEDGEYDFVNLFPSVDGQPSAVPDLLQTGYTVTELTPTDFPATTPTTYFTNVRSGEEYVAFVGQSTPLLGPRLDQSQPSGNNNLQGNATAYPAQTFVPSVSGPLAAVSIEFADIELLLNPSNILVEIQRTDTNTGLPTGSILASAAISPSTDLIGDQTRVEFATPPTLEASVLYAIVVRSASNTTSFALSASESNPYSSGTALTTANNGALWSVVPSNDLVFATFMTQRINVEEVVGNDLIVGNTIYGSLHGFKFEDINGNGSYQPMVDTPLSGVTFQLEGTLADGTEVAQQAVTDSSGEFDFTDLPPNVAGNEQATGYTLTELVPTGFVPTTSMESFFDLLAGEEIVYAAGASDIDPQDPDDPRTEVVDQQGRLIFGNTVLGSIHGFKFEDINGNGIYEPNLGDLPQSGVEFTLTGINGRGETIEGSMVTDSSGAYWFENLWPSVDGSPTEGDDATGYIVTEIVPDGFTATRPTIRTFDLLSRQELVWASGEANIPTDDPRAEVLVGEALTFGNTVLGSIHGFKFEDVNGNGLYEPGFGEAGMPGVTFTLTGIDGSNRPVNRTTTTGIDGEFQFVGLQPSNSDGYLVSEVVPIGFVSTTPTSRTFNLSSRQEYVWQFGAADLGEGDPRVEVLATMDEASNLGEELIFGNMIPGSIHGFKFLDTDGDGIFDENEAGLADIPFQLTGVDGSGATIDTTVLSGEDGEYDFVNLFPSVDGQPSAVPDVLQTGYTVTELVPPDFPATTPTTYFTNVRSGEEYVAFAGQSTPVFGPQLDQAQPLANTELQGDESAYPAQTFVPSVSGPLAAVSIEFSSLAAVPPDSDILVEIQTTNPITDLPTGTVLASAAISPLAGLVGGQTRIDFATPPTLLVGDSYAIVVRSESNTTSFALSASDSNPYSSGTALGTTDDGGNWSIVPGTDLVFATFMTQRINVEEVVGDALVVGNTIYGSLHGFKFEDINGNGSYEPMVDTPLSGVTFQLEGTLADGTEIAQQAVTDSDGEFDFTDLPPNVAGNEQATGYTLTELVPTGFVPTTGVESFFDLLAGQEMVYAAGASDINPQDPNDPRMEVVVGDQLIFGNTAYGSVHGFKFDDADGDGIRDVGELPTPDVTFTLSGTDAQGTVINTTSVTDANGEFWFTQLLPGPNYTITEILPPGFVNTTPLARSFPLTSGQELVWQAGAAMLPPPPVTAVDQQQLNSSEVTDAAGMIFLAQTFVPGVMGQLMLVNIVISATDGAGDVTLQIRPTDLATGQPSGSVLGSVTIPAENIPVGPDSNLSFDFSTQPLKLVDGLSYAMVLRSPTSTEDGFSWRRDTVQNQYEQGTAFGSLDSGANWNRSPVDDFAFTTTMIAETDPRFEVLVGGNGVPLMFGNIVSSSIHGFKYEDLNGDGIQDNNDPPLPGVWFRLTGTNVQGTVIDLVAISDSAGEFWFTGLLPSVTGEGRQTGYTITEILPNGFQSSTGRTSGPLSLDSGEELAWQTGAAMLDDDDPRTEIVVGDQLVFGNTARGSIHGFKFNDINGNGVFDEGEPPAVGVVFMLTGVDTQGNQVNRFETTNEGGQFWFTDLWPSTAYTVMEVVPRGFINTTPIIRTFELQSREELVWRDGAAMLPPPPVATEDQRQTETTSFVSVDSEIIEAQTFTPSVTGQLSSIDITVRTTAATSNVTLSVYDLTETGIARTPVAVRELLGQTTINGIPPSERQTLTFDFALPDLLAGTQYTMVLSAPNADPDSIEWGLSNENYSGGSRLIATTPFAFLLTDPTQIGIGLPPQDHTFTTSMIAEADPRIEILADGDDNGTGEELIFGNTVSSSIHGLKFLDRDADGVYSPENGDLPQAGVTFLLTGIGRGNVPVNRLAVTDDSGQFWFEDLPQSIAGEGKQSGYTVTEIVPNDFFPTTGNTQRTYNLTGGIELAWQEGAAMLNPVLDPQREMVIGQNLMFGNAAKGSIHGFKFLDINGDGLYEPDIGERPLSGVRFLLDGTDANGDVQSLTALTDDDGEFWFENLWPSINGRGQATGYTVKEIVPTDFIPTTPETRLINLFSSEELVWQTGAAMLPAPPLPEVDQQSELSDSISVTVGGMLGQTFTPLVTGGLTQVSIPSPGVPTPGMMLEVQSLTKITTATGTQSVPSGQAIGTGTTTESIDGELIFEFTSPPQLVAGIEYALVLSSLYSQTLQWAFSSSDTYGGGVRLDFVDPVGWQRVPTEDYAFTTVMVASADPRFEVLADSNNDRIGDELMFGNRSGDPEIRWRKETKTGLLGGTTFELTRTHSYNVNDETFTDIIDEIMVVTDNLPPDSNPIAGLFTVSGLQFGIYTLQETIPVPGYDPDTFVETFILTNTDPNQDSEHIFLNTWAKRAFIGSTVALRIAYLAELAVAEAALDRSQAAVPPSSSTRPPITRALVVQAPVVQALVVQAPVTRTPVKQAPPIQRSIGDPLVTETAVTPATETQAVVNPTPVKEFNVSHVPIVAAANASVVPTSATVSTPPESAGGTEPVSRRFSRRNLLASNRGSSVPTTQIQPVMATPTIAAAVDSLIADLTVDTTRAEPEAADVAGDTEVCRPAMRRLASYEASSRSAESKSKTDQIDRVFSLMGPYELRFSES